MTLSLAPMRTPMQLTVLFALTFFGFGSARAAEVAAASGSATTVEELERRPIPGTGLEMRLNLVTQPPGYAPLHHHPGRGFVYMLEGRAESAYGGEAIKRFVAGITRPSPPTWRIAPWADRRLAAL